jgi:hypothetical protein
MRMVSVDMLNLLWWVIFSFMSLCILDSTTSGCFFNSKFQSSSHHIFTPAIYIEIWYFISVIYFSLCIVCMWYVLCNIHIILILLAHPLRTRWSALFFLVTHIVEWIWWSPLDVFKRRSANYTLHQGHSQHMHTHPYEHRRANPTARSIFEDWAGKSSQLSKSPQAPRCRQERHLPLKTQTPLNLEKFALIGSRTQDLRCYQSSCNH